MSMVPGVHAKDKFSPNPPKFVATAKMIIATDKSMMDVVVNPVKSAFVTAVLAIPKASVPVNPGNNDAITTETLAPAKDRDSHNPKIATASTTIATDALMTT